jgi:hypothetical protein
VADSFWLEEPAEPLRTTRHEGSVDAVVDSGHGNVLGLACSHLVAKAIIGRGEPELELFDSARLL